MISTPIGLNEVELVDQFNTTSIQSGKQYLSLILNSKVPNHLTWIVKMWHFGKNSLTGYSGKKFELKWEDILNVFHHIYSKENKGKRRIKKVMNLRDAIQEYPNKPLEEVFIDKLKDDDYKSNKTFSIGLL